MTVKTPTGPDNPSSDYEAMVPYWDKVDAILGGVDAMREQEAYLPRFPLESATDYSYRSATAPFTNIFHDIVENLASKPFSKECELHDGASPRVKELAEDIDGEGNSLSVFASQTFFAGITHAVDWIMVEHTRVPVGATVAAEKALGARPYWVRIPARNMLAAYTAMIGGKEEYVHVRILEEKIEQVGWEETCTVRVRVYERARLVTTSDEGHDVVTWGPPTWTLYEKRVENVPLGSRRRPKTTWVVADSGTLTIPVIPLVAFVPGRRQPGTWRCKPPMQDAADVQIEHFQQEAGLKAAKERSCFPMLAANGVELPKDKNGKLEPLPIGPGAILSAPPDKNGNHGSWDMLEPGAQTLVFLAGDLKATEERLRELGRQPLTAQSGNLTVVTTAFAAQKGNSAVQAWALLLKDALEQAMVFTGLWLAETADIAVSVFTDFDIESKDGTSMQRVIEMRKNRDIPRSTLWHEAKRRGDLSADFDADKAEQELADEAPEDPSEDDLLAARPPGQNDNRRTPKQAAA